MEDSCMYNRFESLLNVVERFLTVITKAFVSKVPNVYESFHCQTYFDHHLSNVFKHIQQFQIVLDVL